MGFRTGIVGLPNVGKSTLFNALTRSAQAQAANFPFCTIDPNVGEVAVPDHRLDRIAEIARSRVVIPARMIFVDIAGLVKGASTGEGLGNRFLANIREVDAIVHVLRCFDDADVVCVSGQVDPVADAGTVATELMLADLDSAERRLQSLQRKLRGGDREAQIQDRLLKLARAVLGDGKPASAAGPDTNDLDAWRQLGLLTAKPVLYVANVGEDDAGGNDYSRAVQVMAEREGNASVVLSAQMEAEIAMLEPAEQGEYLAGLGVEEAGLNRLIQAGYRLLGLTTFFTVGPKEARAWTIPKGTLAPQAAGSIHSDMERGFIAAETVSFDDFLRSDGEQGARKAGLMRSEGKSYEIADGDIVHFLFNV